MVKAPDVFCVYTQWQSGALKKSSTFFLLYFTNGTYSDDAGWVA
jgi:hypothetical protein